ncbi:hypothetical protein HNP49_003098 [Pseudomonas fluvialis]|uniref:Serine protease n=1 Tax=Pseudomonas fluvialis TaxID=1793966 RepID=A0A7X0BU74_9PSED|nr:serine protease [Pseudomonas fluvialis]MBB6342910.1 hypothetical protein [Pseudomonas fluvialis]
MAATASFLTTSVTKLELLCNGNSLGTATGFFYKHQSNWYLVTNWHVLSGRYPKNGQPRHESGAVPDECRFFYCHLKSEQLAWAEATYKLEHPDQGNTLWLQHPSEGQQVDIAVLPIEASHIGLAKDFFDPSGCDPDMLVDLGGEVFLPGYPLGLSASGLMPIWKRASLASSLEFGEGINKFFYVDTATREGMSGAPCIAISNWKHYALDRATNKVRVVERPLSWRLLGVYSGRLNPSDNFEAQIGLVWRETLIEEIIGGGVNGDFHLESHL